MNFTCNMCNCRCDFAHKANIRIEWHGDSYVQTLDVCKDCADFIDRTIDNYVADWEGENDE